MTEDRVSVADISRMATRMAAEYEDEIDTLRARVAELEAQWAARWEPIEQAALTPNGAVTVEVDGAMLSLSELYGDPDEDAAYVSIALPDDIRLCRRVNAPQE